MNVLIVDDNTNDRLLLKKILQVHGCDVAEAADGREALDHLSGNRPDAIISDALMPKIDGFQLLREIRRHENFESVPFIFYSANYTGNQDAQLADSLGADLFIVKPTEPGELWKKLADLFSKGRQRRAAASARGMLEDDHAYLAQYSSVVAAKLEEKVRELEQEVVQRKHAEQRLQALSKSLIEKLELERRHLARELHDELGQVLTAVKMNILTVKQWSDNAGAPPVLPETIVGIDNAIQHVRNLSLMLRPSLLDDLGLQAALRWLADRTSKSSGLAVRFHGNVEGLRLPAEIETACFRIAQESLNNVVRHAEASRAAVKLDRQEESLTLNIIDDGRGFDVQECSRKAAAGGSFGLLGMQERAVLVNARMEIHSEPGTGTQVTVRFPLR